ncbi:MAG: ferritin family protein [candidate division KSB1 bacterium]|nr:ferritin family protein [candidate division KSB1 bacterium]
MTREQFEEAIRFAVEKEEEAAALYESAQKVTVTEVGKKTFAEFAAEERKHKKMLLELRLEGLKQRTVATVPNLKISDYLVDVEFRPDMSYQDMLILAMKREELSLRLYTDLQDRAGDEQLRNLFSLLAQEEARHKLRLETLYDEEILREN